MLRPQRSPQDSKIPTMQSIANKFVNALRLGEHVNLTFRGFGVLEFLTSQPTLNSACTSGIRHF